MRKLLVAFVAAAMAAGCNAETPAASESVDGQHAPNAERSSGTLADIVGVGVTPEGTAPAAAETPPPLVVGDRTLEYPTDLQMTMLAYRLRGVAPPLETWAQEGGEVRRADEFSRPERLRAATAVLQGVYDDTAGIGAIHMRTRGTLSEYDGTRQGFYISTFAPGISFAFNAHEEVTLQFENALAAHLWPLPSDAASAIYERNGRQRGVTIDMMLRIAGVESRGSRTVIRATIQSYTIHGNTRAGQLGAVEVP